MTAEEFLALPERPEGLRQLDLVDGEVVVSEPRWRHNIVQGSVLFALQSWTRAAPGRGSPGLPLDVRLDDRNVFEPDLVWYAEGREPGLDQFPSPLPDLAIEIRSPSTWVYDIGAKRTTYEQHGLPELWLADTLSAQILVFRRSTPPTPRFDVALELGIGDTLTSPRMPGFALALDGLFPDPA